VQPTVTYLRVNTSIILGTFRTPPGETICVPRAEGRRSLGGANVRNHRFRFIVQMSLEIEQRRSYRSINQSCIFRVVQVTKSLQDPLEVGNNLPGISDNVRE